MLVHRIDRTSIILVSPPPLCRPVPPRWHWGRRTSSPPPPESRVRAKQRRAEHGKSRAQQNETKRVRKRNGAEREVYIELSTEVNERNSSRPSVTPPQRHATYYFERESNLVGTTIVLSSINRALFFQKR